MVFKKQILWLHKWLGLFSGIVILIVSLTGCIYVFQDELKLVVYPEKYFINHPAPETKSTIALSKLIAIAEKNLNPGEKISRVDIFPQKDRTWVFRATKTNKKAFFYADYFTYNKRVFINPYSGTVQQIENTKTEFFQIVLQLHMNLLLGKKYGHVIIGFSTLFFSLICISGFFLWWPKKWKPKNIKQHFSIKFSAKPKRLNYDLHNVLGFYVLPWALLFCFTGLVFAFPVFKKGVNNSLNTLDTKKKNPIVQLDSIPQKTTNTLDNGLYYVLSKHAQADQYSIRLQEEKSEPHDIQVRLDKNKTGNFYRYYFDQKSGQIDNMKTSANLQLGGQITSMNYDLHTGTFGGLTTKFLAFFAALICASLPVTGFIIWLNKSKKERKNNKLKKEAASTLFF
ncbi:PepSY-associated TM helix domain-containing protein [Flavobacterium daejeonense]|uniref:PepSY-associated TM helix domain-containing protein n=1 Tax=Flavobacterium daejeonense TaxID=350893 RepID=UPI000552DCE3|nr:PepSY-associated TM helix domain-containing protein [Flavobacterium daejeonense]